MFCCRKDDEIYSSIHSIGQSSPTAYLKDCCEDQYIDIHTENQRHFVVLSSEEIVEEMNFYVNEVNKILNANFSATITRILLNHYKWDKDILIDKYFGTDNETFFKDAHVVNPFTNEENCNTILKEYKMADCGICLDTTNVTGVLCGHQFCDDCWNKYLTAKIKDDGKEQIFCPEVFCDIIVGDSAVLQLLTDSDVKLKYNRLITNSFVKLDRNLRWCPKPGCTYVTKLISSECEAITCNCGHKFCYGCDEEPHAPISCENLKKWYGDDTAIDTYISTFTKRCPKCQSPIEKNGGCPHMTCKHCKFQFCWKCLRKYKSHESCENLDQPVKLHQERLTFCWSHFSYNRTASKDEQDLFTIEFANLKQDSFVKNGVDTLLQCRGALMYTYAFIYYVTENNFITLIELQLESLRSNTDKLSKLLENYVLYECDEKMDAQNIIDLIGNLKSQRQKLLHSVEDGIQVGRWED